MMGGGGLPWPYVLIGLGLFLGFLYQRHLRRLADMRALATRFGFHYLGDALPRFFSLDGTGLSRATSVWNVIDGERYGVRILIFDCRIGKGKHSWTRTAIAAQTKADVFGAMLFEHCFMSENSGDWRLLYWPEPSLFGPFRPGLTPLQELEAQMDKLIRSL
jgi:hypothetical protein